GRAAGLVERGDEAVGLADAARHFLVVHFLLSRASCARDPRAIFLQRVVVLAIGRRRIRAGGRGARRPRVDAGAEHPHLPCPSRGRGIAYEANLSLLDILNLLQDPSRPTRGAFGKQNPPKLARPRGEVAPRPEAPSPAAKWALKQVQGDEFGGAGAHCDPPALKGRLALRSKANGV